MVRYCFDIDDTICHTVGEDYAEATPDLNVVTLIQQLKSLGAEIIIYTARGSKTGIDFRGLTTVQLHVWGVPFDELHLGKPYADVYIDDKAINAISWKNRQLLNPLNELKAEILRND